MRCERLMPRVFWTRADDLDPAKVAELISELPAEEAEQAGRFHFDADRATYTAAHVMLRRVLRARLGGSEPNIVRNPLGRPELAASAAGRTPSFNLTHTRGFAACVVLDNGPIGIDAEDIRRPVDDIAAMARRCYVPSERALLDALPEPQRTEMFYRLWTLKEAILKATGHGLRIEPDRFAVDPLRARAAVPADLGIATRWRLTELAPLPYIRIALAVPGEGPLTATTTRCDLA
jgi:4'-phosphopantetheinyl transferase